MNTKDNSTLAILTEDENARRYSQLVRACIRPYFLKGGDYDDLYQEGMIGLLSAMRTFDPLRSDSFEAYAALCIKRRVIDAVRRDSSRERGRVYPNYPDEAYDAVSAGQTAPDPEVNILASEAVTEISRSLKGSLSPFEASVLSPYLEGYTASEIAQLLGRQVKSVDNAIGRIRAKLSRYLSSRR